MRLLFVYIGDDAVELVFYNVSLMPNLMIVICERKENYIRYKITIENENSTCIMYWRFLVGRDVRL